MLWTCLLLPSLALDVFARAQTPEVAARPFAVTTGGHYPRAVAVNDAAATAGVASGQLVSAALALAPELVLHERDPRAEASALEAVATWATQFTPTVSVAPPNAVLAEIGGSLRLFGGLARLSARLARGAHDLGYAARLAYAPTPTAALLLARSGHTAPVSASALRAALAPLPLAQLEVDPAAVTLLAAAGIITFGQACALPRDALARRVGAAFVDALDRARARIPDPRPPFVAPPRYEGRLALPAAVENVQALAFAVNRLVHELAGWLLGRGLGIVGMTLTLEHERYGPARAQRAAARDAACRRESPAAAPRTSLRARSVSPAGDATTVRFGLAAPAREPAHLIAVLRERLARVVLPAPVVGIMLESEETAPLASRNLGLLPGDEAAATVPLLDRLRARLGEDAVTLVMPQAEHRPERAWAYGERDEVAVAARHAPPAEAPDLAATAPRPLWLLTEPEPLGQALETRPWVLRDGPERIESGWWDGNDVRRDYFIAQTPRGETVWIYRDHRYGVDDGEWFLHGVFA